MREFAADDGSDLRKLFGAPSLSSRAINDACKLAGTAIAEEGITAAVRVASSSESVSRTAFVISSTNNGIPSVRSMMS